MRKAVHPRSPCAQLTEGVTLDHAARLYDWLAPIMTLGLETRLHRLMIERLDINRPLSVIDVGCGTGTLTRQIHEAMPTEGDHRTLGIDAAEAMIRVAQRKTVGVPGIDFEAARAEALPCLANSFDRAVSAFFFHHVHYELKCRSLNEIWRVLNPGGRAVIVDVDMPYSRFGALCAYAGYWLFKQPEIKENIDGRLREALDESKFRGSWRIVSRHSGYITLFELHKEEKETEG